MPELKVANLLLFAIANFASGLGVYKAYCCWLHFYRHHRYLPACLPACLSACLPSMPFLPSFLAFYAFEL
jgi:hypothetical protein